MNKNIQQIFDAYHEGRSAGLVRGRSLYEVVANERYILFDPLEVAELPVMPSKSRSAKTTGSGGHPTRTQRLNQSKRLNKQK